jgi:integrase
MKLTKAAVARLSVPDGKTEVIHFDDDIDGFGLRLRAGGSRTWIIQYRHGRQQRRMTFGTVSTLAADDARQRAQDLLAQVRLGRDPQAEKQAARAAAADQVEDLTLGALVALCVAYAAKRQKPRTLRETKRHLERAWRPLHAQPVAQLSRRQVAARLVELADETGGVNANRARAALSACFTWAMRAGLAETNPVVGTGKLVEERPRDRVLTDEELRLVWQATEGPGDYNVIVRLLMLLGQRREEVAGLRWSELDLERAIWRLPAARSKNGEAHEVPLSSPALAILRDRPRRASRDLVFGEGAGPFSNWTIAKRRLDARMAALAGQTLKPWVLHDLRRSLVTSMAEMGVEPHVIEAVVNHRSGHKAGVAGIYNHAKYMPVKRMALKRWADHLHGLVSRGTGEGLLQRA